ncbi:hypothetical protein PoB_006388200 [Plakobranchus ocellatus]|uniref:Uncharacterized protein n=1 Tax=Plakobranchus ocellatus TaxID=259542 RepID=A0AAV4CZR0_9GAST|nr:hypothetical protein PoB_006388200 [Plakobranchus ocellatus]
MAGPPRAIQELVMRIVPTFGPFTKDFWPVFQNQVSENIDSVTLLGPEVLSRIYLKCALSEEILGNSQASFRNADKCIELTPVIRDGYTVAVRVKAKEKDYLTAALYTFRMIRDAEIELPFTISKPDWVMKLAIFLTNITDPADWKKFKFFTKCPQHFTLSTEEWREILDNLYHGDQFQTFSLLTTGNCGVPFEPQTYIHKLADVPGMRYQWADVGYVVKHLKGKEGKTKAWHLRLADFLVKRGADVYKISQAFGQPLLVIMTTLSVEGEVPSFLNLAWEHVSCSEYDKTDRMNNTPLHAFVKTSNWKTFRMAEVVLRDLLSHGCLALIKDNRGKMPYEYVPSSHAFHKLLQNAASGPANPTLLQVPHTTAGQAQYLATALTRPSLLFHHSVTQWDRARHSLGPISTKLSKHCCITAANKAISMRTSVPENLEDD